MLTKFVADIIILYFGILFHWLTMKLVLKVHLFVELLGCWCDTLSLFYKCYF
jgi:hypothetical protein